MPQEAWNPCGWTSQRCEFNILLCPSLVFTSFVLTAPNLETVKHGIVDTVLRVPRSLGPYLKYSMEKKYWRELPMWFRARRTAKCWFDRVDRRRWWERKKEHGLVTGSLSAKLPHTITWWGSSIGHLRHCASLLTHQSLISPPGMTLFVCKLKSPWRTMWK